MGRANLTDRGAHSPCYSPPSPSHSSSLSSLMLKYRNSYEVLFGATTWRKSRSCCFFKYFFVRYFKYRLENGASAVTWILDFSRATVTASPRFPVLPPTLMRSLKNFSRSATVKMLSSTGCWQSTVNLRFAFLVLVPAFFFNPLITMASSYSLLFAVCVWNL